MDDQRRIAVIGAGSAGLLSAAHLCTWLDNSWEVCAIHNPKRKILGIGESTNGAFISVLERGTNFSLARPEDLRALDATIKHGSKFVDWRPEPWVNPLLSGNIAIHFNSRHLGGFVYERLSKLWPQQFRVLEGHVEQIRNYADHVAVSIDGKAHDFDYVVDCSGTPANFDGYTSSDCTLIDRCRIHVVENYEYEPFTDHIATEHGWMFGVPLRSGKTYGYLYSHELTAPEAAAEDMKRLLGTETLDAGGYDAEYAFESYYANELISGRVCKNGNKALFFEPLVANSIFLYIHALRLIFDHIVRGQDAARCNGLFVKAVQEMEDVISYYYQGGSTHDSPFWRAAAEQARRRLEQRPAFHDYLHKLRELKAKGVIHTGPTYAFSPHTWQVVDEHMGYHYVDPEASE